MMTMVRWKHYTSIGLLETIKYAYFKCNTQIFNEDSMRKKNSQCWMRKKLFIKLCYWLEMDLRKMNEIIQQLFIGDQSDLTVIDRKWKRPTDRLYSNTPMHKRKETRTRMRTRLTQFIIGRMQFMSFICSFVRKTSHNFKCDEKNLDIARSRCDQYGWSVYWWNWFLWSFSGRSCWYCFHISIYIQMRSSANDPLRPASAWKVAAAISRAD